MSKRTSTRGERQSRLHRRYQRPLNVTVHAGPARGPGVSVPSLDDFLTALRTFDGDAPWETIAEDILPMFERRRPFPPGSPVTVVLPPGVTVGFGIDLGPALVRVGDPLLALWAIDKATLVTCALENVRRRARLHPRLELVRERIDDVVVEAFQSQDGWASVLLLVPDALKRIVGAGPRLLTAPMRDLLLAFPADVPIELARDLTEEFEAADPNALALESFGWSDGDLSCRPLRRAIRV